MKTEIEYHRNPLKHEILFGLGCTFYCDIPISECLNASGKPKQWCNFQGDRWYL